MSGPTSLAEEACALFRATWQRGPECLASSPGRVNLIGEHTDYNDGFVFPVAINRRTFVAMGASRDGRSGFVSTSHPIPVLADCPPWRRMENDCWANYVAGVAAQFANRNERVPAFRASVASDLPAGAGLSSSAALEAATAAALSQLVGASFSITELAALCQKAEHEFAGVRCGIMDQMSSVAGGAIVLDCRSLAFQRVQIPTDLSLVILDSGIPRGLSATRYNERRGQCEEGVRVLKGRFSGIKALRDVTPGMLDACRKDLSETVFRRCRHVVTENVRVSAAAKAFAENDFPAVGKLLQESHVSMRDDYEISLPEIDLLVEIASSTPGCYGARLTGAGFGGAVISLVDTGSADVFAEEVVEEYRKKTCKAGTAMRVVPDEGSRKEEPV
ncbi:MAG TPA: galactokinase [Candidatus Latescibacteria bacterium]|nr:galactokinase [Candidatus Latescibacterota bacterium]